MIFTLESVRRLSRRRSKRLRELDMPKEQTKKISCREDVPFLGEAERGWILELI